MSSKYKKETSITQIQQLSVLQPISESDFLFSPVRSPPLQFGSNYTMEETEKTYRPSSKFKKDTKPDSKQSSFPDSEDRSTEIKQSTSSKELKEYLQVKIKNNIEKVDEINDSCPFLELRRSVLRIRYYFSDLLKIVVESSLFNIIVFLFILANTIELGFEDPTWVDLPSPFDTIEVVFTCFYTVEFGMKAIAYGLFMNSDSYFRSWWNLLDFVIIFTGWLSIYAKSGIRLSSLRSLRILRPLRSINSISGMNTLFTALVNAIWPLFSALFILFFFVLIFAIIAVQLWAGELRGRCLAIETGTIDNLNYICGDSTCFVGEKCVKMLDNPNNGVTHYDNIFISFITVFQVITLEGWTNNLVATQTAYSYWSVLYFMPLVFITANLILNFVQAIIAITFKQVASNLLKDKASSEKFEYLNEAIFNKIYKVSVEGKHLSMDLAEDLLSPESMRNRDLKVLDIDEVSDNYLKTDVDDKKNEFQGSLIPDSCLLGCRNEAGLGDGISSDLIIACNSIFCETFKEKSTSIGCLDLFDKDFHYSRDCKGHSRTKTGSKDIGYNSTAGKARDEYQKLKSVVTIKRKTLKYLKKNPGFIKSSRVEVQNTKQKYESAKDVVYKSPTASSIIYNECQFSTSEIPLITYHKKLTQDHSSKFPELKSPLKLFKRLSLKSTKKSSFFLVNISVKCLASELPRNSSILFSDWSGLDVSPGNKNYHLSASKQLSSFSCSLWASGSIGAVQKMKYPIRSLITHKYFNYLMLIAVAVNTVVLSLERYDISQSDEDLLQTINMSFTYFFFAEVVLKIISLGPLQFTRDLMNIFDTVVVILSLIEVFLLSSGLSALSSFRAIRILRVFRVLRVVRLFRYLTSLSDIVTAISKSLSSIVYLFLLLLLFQVVFTLIGMQIYGGTFNFSGTVPRGNFDSFHWAFVTTYQVLSIENWNDVLTSSLRSQAGEASCLFLVFWIVLGNFIMLNLFLAILLDSFSNKEDEEVLASTKKYQSKMRQKIENLDKFLGKESESFDSLKDDLKAAELFHSECDKSYFVFSKTSHIRVFCHRLVRSQNFDYAMLFLIIINSVKLVGDTYMLDSASGSIEVQISNELDVVFTVLFDLEFLIKSVAFGLITSSDSYLRDNWNLLDFTIMILSNIDLALTNVNIPIIKVFRMLRTLRPLKLIKHNVSLKIVVNALLESIVAILNVWILILMIFLIFAILGVSLLSGKMHFCSFPGISDKASCISSGYEWSQSRFNFDNVLEAGIVLFILMSQESWPNRMLEGVDAREAGLSPVINYNSGMCYFYIVFLFVSNFFLLNLFTCIVFEKFNEAKKCESSLTSFLSSKELVLWAEIQELVTKAKPWPKREEIKLRIRVFFYRISKSKYFEIMMFVFVLVNMLSMAMPYYEASDEYNNAANNINLICTFVFIAEALIKITGLGLHYFKSNLNRFDFLIVFFSVIDVIVSFAFSSYTTLLIQLPQIIRIMRVIRVLRLFRLIRSLQTLEKILMVMGYSLPAILNVLGLLILIFFIYAILGCYLFHDVGTNIGITNWYNFSNFHNAMNILWRISTGEDYPSIMADTISAKNNYGNALYFISFVTIVDFVVLELFITITLQYFEEFYTNPFNAVSIFKSDLKSFKEFWTVEAKEHYDRVSKNGLAALIGGLGLRFKFLKNNDKVSVYRLIGALNIKNDVYGNYYFNDVLYAVLRRKYERKVNKRENKNDFKIMKAHENNILNKIQRLRESYSRKRYWSKNNRPSLSEENKTGIFERVLLVTIFNSWKKYSANAGIYNNQATPENSDDECLSENSIKITEFS